MQFPSLGQLFRRPAPGAYTALDIGTEYAKALVFSIENDHGTILGTGRHPQSQSAMQDGLITDIEAVVTNCHAALSEAEAMAGGIVARLAIVGLAGELVKGASTTITIERERPAEKLSPEELEGLLERVQRRALDGVTRQLRWAMDLPNVDVRLVNAAVVAVKIDGHLISNPIGFQGRHVEVTVFDAFAPLVHVGASETIARALDLELLSVVAEPYAVASSVDFPAATQIGGIFIDVGGGTTDVALVRNGGIEATESFALGGRAFTRRIALEQGLSLEEAENLKLRYARKELTPAASRDLRKTIERDVTTWMDGVHLMLEELAGESQLPPYVYLCGGASALPDIGERLKQFPWTERLACPRQPQVTLLKPSDISAMTDATGTLVDQQDVTPLGLAFQALALQRRPSLVNEALIRAKHVLKL